MAQNFLFFHFLWFFILAVFLHFWWFQPLGVFFLNSGGQKLPRVMVEIDVRPIGNEHAYFFMVFNCFYLLSLLTSFFHGPNIFINGPNMIFHHCLIIKNRPYSYPRRDSSCPRRDSSWPSRDSSWPRRHSFLPSRHFSWLRRFFQEDG